jgi:hypothetical protein
LQNAWVFPQGLYSEAKQHVNAVKENPCLIHLPKKDAIKTSKNPTQVDLLNIAYKDFPQLKETSMPSEKVIEAADKLRTIPLAERISLLEKVRGREEQLKEELKRINQISAYEEKQIKKIEKMVGMEI